MTIHFPNEPQAREHKETRTIPEYLGLMTCLLVLLFIVVVVMGTNIVQLATFLVDMFWWA